MSIELTQRQMALSRSVGAALLIQEAKVKEHEAACLIGGCLEIARQNVLSATEAVLDARERLYRELLPQ